MSSATYCMSPFKLSFPPAASRLQVPAGHSGIPYTTLQVCPSSAILNALQNVLSFGNAAERCK